MAGKSTPIQIDLLKVTPEQLEAAREHEGTCKYIAPCIIGAMMTPQQRVDVEGSGCVTGLVMLGLASFPNNEQIGVAQRMQDAFDSCNYDLALEIFNGYRTSQVAA